MSTLRSMLSISMACPPTHNDRTNHDGDAAEEDTKKEDIIAILEDWAAWEKSLEDEAEKDEATRSIKAAADQPAPAASIEQLDSPSYNRNCALDRGVDTVATAPSTKQGKNVLRSTYSAGDAAQLLGPTRRERRLSQHNDPVVKARRRALREWATEKRRCSLNAAAELAWKPTELWGGALLSDKALEPRDASPPRERTRSSPNTTVGLARNPTGLRCGEGARPGDKALESRSAPPREASARDRSCGDSRHEQQPASERTAAAGGNKPPPQPCRPHARRTSIKGSQKAGRPSPCTLDGGEGMLQIVASIPKSPAGPSAGARRASPWARSPSRETAGGILVKQRFFYGSSGGRRASAPAGSAAASPSFESQWMRQFREEVQSNANWWVGTDRYQAAAAVAAGPVASAASAETFRGARRRLGGKQPRTPISSSSAQGKRHTKRTPDLWDEVNSLLASGRYFGHEIWQRSGDSRGGGGGAGFRGGGAGNSEFVDALSFGDRLRYTPLSQGAWLVDRAEGVRPKSVNPQPRGGGGGGGRASDSVAYAEAARPRLSTVNGTKNTDGRTTRVEADSVRREACLEEASTDGSARRGEHEGLRRRETLPAELMSADVGVKRGEHRDLQGVHDAILARLRGEIDPFTREKIVLRAAEDARGALARDQARGASPRRASGQRPRAASTGSRLPVLDATIDYDKVEATLSLIELASRTAGPDAGKQMLQALQGLSKIHERRVTGGSGGSGGSGEEIVTANEAEGRGGATASAGGAEDDAGGGCKKESASADEGDPDASEAAGVDEGESRGPGGGKAGAMDRSSSTEGKEGVEVGQPSPCSEGKQEDVNRAPPRKLSLAVSSPSSSSSEGDGKPSDSESDSGVIQSPSSWLWGAGEREIPKQGAESPAPEVRQEAFGGLEGFAEAGRIALEEILEQDAQEETPSGKGSASSGNGDGTSSGKGEARPKEHDAKPQASQTGKDVQRSSRRGEAVAQVPTETAVSETAAPNSGAGDHATETLSAHDSNLSRDAPLKKLARDGGEGAQDRKLSDVLDSEGLPTRRPVTSILSPVSKPQPSASKVDGRARLSRFDQESTKTLKTRARALSVQDPRRATHAHENRVPRGAQSASCSAEARVVGWRHEGDTVGEGKAKDASVGRPRQNANGATGQEKGSGYRAGAKAADDRVLTLTEIIRNKAMQDSSSAVLGGTRTRCVSRLWMYRTETQREICRTRCFGWLGRKYGTVAVRAVDAHPDNKTNA